MLRRFALVRRVDPSGVSGTGVVAYGVQFADGHVVLRWHSRHPATSLWGSLSDLLLVHGHDGATTVRWIDAETTEAVEATVIPHPRQPWTEASEAPELSASLLPVPPVEAATTSVGRHRAG